MKRITHPSAIILTLLAAAGCSQTKPLTQQAASAKPNILFIFTDQQQAKMMSAYGGFNVATPAMDSIAARGHRFTRAFCVTPQCSPSRAALLTGRWPHEVNMMGNVGNPSPPLDPAIRNAATIFNNAGYKTAYFGKWHLGNDPSKYGFKTAPGRRGDRKTTADAVEYLRDVGPGPFLTYVSFVNPHDVYHTPKRGQRPHDTANIKLPPNFADDLSAKPWPHRHFLEADQGKRVAGFDSDDWKQYLAQYKRITQMVDGQIGAVLQALADGGHADDTVIIFTSDHGDLAASNGLPYKCPAMYEELIRLPLVIAYPARFPKPSVINDMVSLIDLLPTMCHLANIDIPEQMRGHSLIPLLEGRPVPNRDAIFAEYYGKQKWMAPIRMIRTDRWKYCLYKTHGEELYDLVNDPGELHNLAADKRFAKTKTTLRNRLEQWMQQTNDPFDSLQATDRKGKPLTKR